MLFETMKFEPRDVNRIQPFCDWLAKAWEKLPDWRFGQLMVNLMRDYEAEHGRDIFYLEEVEMIREIKAYCERISGGNAK